MKSKLMLLLALLIWGGAMWAQQTRKLTGKVVDEDGLPVIGALVLVDDTQIGAATDNNGVFNIQKAPEQVKLLRVSCVGMEPRTVAYKNNIVVVMQSSMKLNEVMVVAFGTAKKAAFTGSAKVVESDELAKSQVTSVTSALQGAVPGLQLTQSNGAPGSSPTIRIRGFSSITAGNDPLIILDGAPYSGDIANLNPADVESMTVLKDAASNALYGARGANGVIMITTKSGKKGKPAVINFDAKWGSNTSALRRYDVIDNPAEYYEMQYRALNNTFLADGQSATQAWKSANAALLGNQSDGGVGYNIWSYPQGQMLIGQNGKLNPNATLGRVVNYNGEQYLLYPDNWEDVGTRTGFRQEYNMSVTGSSNKGNFFFSLGYLDHEGITYKSGMERLTGRLRADYQAKDWLKVGANVSYAHFSADHLSNNGNDVSTGNVWAFVSQMAPIYPAFVRNADGSIMRDANGLKMYDYGNTMNAGLNRPFIGDANPIQDNLLNTYRGEGNASTGHAFADFTIIPGLVFTLNGTYNLDETRYNLVYNPYYGQFDTTGGTVNVEHDRSYNFNLQQLLNYNVSLGKKKNHNLNIMLGHEYYKVCNTSLYASKYNMFSQGNHELNGAVVDGQGAGSYRQFYNNEGFFGRFQYDFNNRAFLSASIRRDASSRFHPDHRWGTFWSVGAAWLINKEKWFNASWVNELKVKASYGSQGNDNIGDYLYIDRYDVVNSDGNIGTAFYGKGTKDITWETNANLNAGLEFTLFKNRLHGSVEYYRRATTDMLFQFSVAPSLGYSSYMDNVGDMYNTGVEIDLDATLVRKRNVQWDFRVNFATLKNRVTMLHPDKKTSTYFDRNGKPYDGYVLAQSGDFFVSENTSLFTWMTKEWAGLDETTGEPQWWKTVYKKDDKGEFILDADGHKIMEDREKTKTYSEADYYVQEGTTTIPNFYGGFGTTVKFYGFDLSINCSYSIGGKQYDGTYATLMTPPSSFHSGYTYHKDLYNAWSPTNTSAEIPRFQYGDQNFTSYSDRFLTNSSYLNIENINLGYTFPIKNKNIESIRVYGAAENVFYLSARKGFDPRQSYIDRPNAANYSPIRSISGGVSLTF